LLQCLIQIEEECNKELAENPNKESARRLLRRAKEDYKRYIEPLLQTTTQASGAPLPKSKGVQERERNSLLALSLVITPTYVEWISVGRDHRLDEAPHGGPER
jgi:hypothetical protein